MGAGHTKEDGFVELRWYGKNRAGFSFSKKTAVVTAVGRNVRN